MSEDSYQQKQPTLIWNTARGVWERVGMESLLCEHLEPFSATWPTEGMMRNGQVFELPMQEHRTTAFESSSSPTLPTPNTMDNLPAREGEAYERMLRRGKDGGSRREKSGNLREVIHHNLPTPATSEPGFTFQPVDKDGNPTDNPNERWYHPETGRLVQKGIKQVLDEGLLRTPAASEGERGHQPASKAKARGGQQTLSGQFLELFPTPNTMDFLPARTPEQKEANKGKGGYANVRETVVNDISTNWGKFEPAIRRWEGTIGRSAPAPTKPDGKDGNHRLSSKFTEWMMGLPDGWITDVGLTRNEELKACGNGVVPQQAELALRVLLNGHADLARELPILPTVMANGPMRNSRRAMVTHPTKRSSVALNQAIELMQGVLPVEFESWDEVPDGYKDAGGQVNLPTPTVSDTFTDNLKSTQQKPGSMHSVTLPQAVRWVSGE